MAQADRASFEATAFDDPYGHLSQEERELIADDVTIIVLDAASHEDIPNSMSWGQANIGGGGPLTLKDYGRHRENNETLGDIQDFVREKLKEGPGGQYLKYMNDDKTEVAEAVVAISMSDGIVVEPYFGEIPEGWE